MGSTKVLSGLRTRQVKTYIQDGAGATWGHLQCVSGDRAVSARLGRADQGLYGEGGGASRAIPLQEKDLNSTLWQHREHSDLQSRAASALEQ